MTTTPVETSTATEDATQGQQDQQDPQDQSDQQSQPAASDDTALGEAGQKALAAERKARQDAERAAKVAQRELDNLKRSQMSETEKAIALARDAGKAEATTQFGVRLAQAEFKAAAAAKQVDITELLDDLNMSRFLTEDGEPDATAISQAVDRFAKAAPQGEKPPNFDGGPRSTPKTTNMNDLIRSQLKL